MFLLVVGDYEALLPHLPYRGAKKVLFARYVAFEEWALRYMTSRALTFANGAALRAKHEQQGARVIETKTTTLSQADIGTRTDVLSPAKLRALTVSRIDPRKGLRVLPAAIAQLVASGIDITIDIVGPTIGLIGDDERDAIREAATTAGVADRVRLLGPVPLDRLMSTYRDYDVFILPTQPGEGIPRVLLEAMANGLPVITTGVSGISSLITDGSNGLVVAESSADAIARRGRAALARRDAAAALDPGRLCDGEELHAGETGCRNDGDCRPRTSHPAGRQGRRVKICFVIPTLTSGGAERVAVTVLSGLDGTSPRARALCLQ